MKQREIRGPITILMADDDPDDCLMTREAFEESGLASDLHFVADGEELVDYLYRRGKFSDPHQSPRPDLILLDLNMPRKDGREALEEIKVNPDLCCIPIVGASSFIIKPVTFAGLVAAIKGLSEYWFETVELPPQRET